MMELPPELSMLLTPAGLGVVVVLVVQYLKKLKGQDWKGKVGEWVRANAFLASVIVAGGIAGIVSLVYALGYGESAESAYGYLSLILSWFFAQGIYNTGKAAANNDRK
jgi:formate hydrogenlyase subunit 3/multisubunit Na+/H+ antiporter MnhD subunit